MLLIEITQSVIAQVIRWVVTCYATTVANLRTHEIIEGFEEATVDVQLADPPAADATMYLIFSMLTCRSSRTASV